MVLATTRTTSQQARSRTCAITALLACSGAAALNAPAGARAATISADALADLSIEELTEVRVTSVSRRAEPRFEAAAAVYVITRDEILRAGVTSIPEALRLAPGVEVARNGAHSWTISIRGFNSDLSNKLLVLIDGRSVYSPLFAGVFWDTVDTLLEDVERIEVIAGPGGTLWGANAVNGVINIITRAATETPGGYVQFGGGGEEGGYGGFRYGHRLGPDGAIRAYAKYFDRDPARSPAGGEAVDEWQMAQGGFRLDRTIGAGDRVTIQGDVYEGEQGALLRDDFTLGTLPGPSVAGDIDVAGANLLTRWERALAAGGALTVQAYFDRTERDIRNTFSEIRNTADMELQHRIAPGTRHRLQWGGGLRVSADEVDSSLFATFEPGNRTDFAFNAFVQDEIALVPEQLFLTLGSKFEHNDYTGFEIQPNARLRWQASEAQLLWTAVSRAVRIPSRLDADLALTAPVDIGIPLYIRVSGSDDFDAKELVAYEAGYRLQAGRGFTFDVATFYHDYDSLQSTEPSPPVFVGTPLAYVILPATLANRMEGESYGATAMSSWQPLARWRLRAQYTYFRLQLHARSGSNDQGGEGLEGNSPEHQLALHSFLDLPLGLSLYGGLRYVDALPNLAVRSYVALDMSLRWRPTETLELAVSGRNLADGEHLEFGGGNLSERSVYGQLVLRF